MADPQTLNFGTATNPDADKAAADHNAAMAAKFDANAQAAKNAAEPTTGTTPPVTPPAATDLLAGKFKSQDDLIKAYKELESKLGAPKPPVDPAAPVTPPVTPPVDPLAIDPNAAKAVEEAGLDMSALTRTFTEKGTLSDDEFAKLAKAGISKEMVTAFAEGQRAIADKQATEVMTAVGIKGDDEFKSIVAWAQQNLSAEDIAAHNAMTKPGTPVAQQKLALEALHGRYLRAGGSDPKLIAGQAGKVGGESYQSQAQWTADMRDPKYKTDPAFRAAVMAKLGRSNI